MYSPLNDHYDNEEEKLSCALNIIFPHDWIQYALESPHHYLNVSKLVKKYDRNVSKEILETIHKVIEFFCYEVIETTILVSPYEKLTLVYPFDIIKGIEQDEVLLTVLEQQRIYIVETITIRPNDIIFHNIKISRKGTQLIRIFIELLIKNTLKTKICMKNSTNEHRFI